ATILISGLNSASTCRQAPHDKAGASESVTTTPVKMLPASVSNAAATENLEKGAWTRLRTLKAAFTKSFSYISSLIQMTYGNTICPVCLLRCGVRRSAPRIYGELWIARSAIRPRKKNRSAVVTKAHPKVQY